MSISHIWKKLKRREQKNGADKESNPVIISNKTYFV